MDDTRVQRMEQAALWLQRMHAGADDERVVESWLDWCQRDPLNQQAFDEIAAVLGLSVPTVKRDWTRARAWLHRSLQSAAS